MLTSPGWRGPISQHWTLLAFTSGLVLGGILTAALVWVAGGLVRPLLGQAGAAALVAASLVLLAREMGVLRFKLPERASQIPQSVFALGPVQSSFRFGFGLGTGARTHMTASLPYLALVGVAVLAEQAPVALLAGMGFGLGRAILAWTLALSPRSVGWEEDLARHSRLLRVLLAASAAAASLILAWG
jgi:hypothetical protein